MGEWGCERSTGAGCLEAMLDVGRWEMKERLLVFMLGREACYRGWFLEVILWSGAGRTFVRGGQPAGLLFAGLLWTPVFPAFHRGLPLPARPLRKKLFIYIGGFL